MPKRAKELSAVEVRRITERGLHAVGGVAGLMLQVSPTGSRSWILRAMVGQKRRDIGLGAFPDVTIAQARDQARETRLRIREGIDPIAEREAARQALIASQRKRLTFAEAARRKHAAIEHEFRNPKHRKQWLSSLENHAFPVLGELDVSEIEVSHVMAVLEPIWYARTETASRVRQRMEAVFSWAIASRHRDAQNPAQLQDNLAALLPAASKIKKRGHHTALDWDKTPDFMAALRARTGISARALDFAILTAARSGEVRLATWDEIDLDAGLWIIPAERTKAGKKHRVPLSADTKVLLRALPRMAESPYVFAGRGGRALSDNSLRAVIQRMGVDAVPHGFRSSFKDWARNETGFADEVSELALGHVNSDATRAAYARDELLSPRRRLMDQWTQFLNTGTAAPHQSATNSDTESG